MEDIDNDGNYDVGIYISNIYDLLDGLLIDKIFVVVSDMLFFFMVYVFDYYLWEIVDVIIFIIVSFVYYYDEDIFYEDLVISYCWYINGNFVEDVLGDILFVYCVIVNDLVEVVLVVLDSVNIVEFDRMIIVFLDVLVQVVFENLFEFVLLGDYVEFNVIIFDLDFGDNQGVVILVLVFLGVIINENGLIFW